MQYKIGDFSKMTKLTVKTLRYYHELGILVPSTVDEQTGYRFYNKDSYETAQLIQLLKSFDFTISEIEEILANYEDDNDIKAYLLEKNEMIQEKINHYKKLQKDIEAFYEKKEVHTMHQEMVKNITVDDQLIGSITYVGKYQDVGTYIGQLYKTIGGNVKGKPFCIYHDDSYKEEDATVEVCLPIKKSLSYKNVEVKTIKGGSAISLIHIGSYETLSRSYKQITDHMINNNIEPAAPIQEHYLKGPGMLLKGNPDKYQTQLIILI